MNIRGFWEYDDCIGLGCKISKGDIIYVLKSKNNMVIAIHEDGNARIFHKTYITKECFGRLAEKGHEPSSCGAKGMFGCNCKKCDIWIKKELMKKKAKVLIREFKISDIVWEEINYLDPIKLFPDAPKDLYKTEIKAIIKRLPRAKKMKEIQEILYVVFFFYFGKDGRNRQFYLQTAKNVKKKIDELKEIKI